MTKNKLSIAPPDKKKTLEAFFRYYELSRLLFGQKQNEIYDVTDIPKTNKFYELAANVKYAPFFSNKVNFHKNFSEFTKREFVSYDDGFSKVKDFISNHKEFVRKPISGLGGQDVVKLASSDVKDMKTFYEKLKEEMRSKYADDRVAYTKGKQNMINKILGK